MFFIFTTIFLFQEVTVLKLNTVRDVFKKEKGIKNLSYLVRVREREGKSTIKFYLKTVTITLIKTFTRFL